MKLGLTVACALSVWTGLPVALSGQSKVEPEAGPKPAVEASSSKPGWCRHAELPAWLGLGAELRGRAELNHPFVSALNDRLYLNRLRLDVTLRPSRWVRFVVQAQDARAYGPAAVDRESQRNTLDLRQAYADFGLDEEGWHLRAGRQELSAGDERLIGADSYWDTFGLAYDAVRLGYTGERLRLDAFTGFRVQPARRRLDPFDTASRISGLTLRFKTSGEGVVEPYFLWKRGGDTVDLTGSPGHRDVLTPGVRAQGDLPPSLDYNVEMALERGHVVADRIAAWAGHWELGWKPLGREFGLRLALEYNFATGDQDPADGRYGTFDDLYPAGFNKYGMADPIAWRNIRYPAIGMEMPLTRRWTVYAAYRLFRLASVHDGLYPGGDQYLVRNPLATSAEVGSHALVSAGYVPSSHWRFYAGTATFSRASTCASPGAPRRCGPRTCNPASRSRR